MLGKFLPALYIVFSTARHGYVDEQFCYCQLLPHAPACCTTHAMDTRQNTFETLRLSTETKVVWNNDAVKVPG